MTMLLLHWTVDLQNAVPSPQRGEGTIYWKMYHTIKIDNLFPFVV